MKVGLAVRVLAGLSLAAGVVAPSPGANAANGAGSDWPSVAGAADESGYSQLGSINTANAGRLGLAWSLDLPGEVALEATPLAVDGMLYFPGGRSKVYAVDGASGKLRWTYDPQGWKVNPDKYNFGVNRGVAYDDGRVFVATNDGRLIALNAADGKELWSVKALPEKSLHTMSGAPRTFRGKVIIGNGGADVGQRGFVTAYDQATGRQVWRFYTVPGSPDENRGDPVMEMIAGTWSGEWWKTGTGGTVWNGMTFDPEFNRIYIGVGNAGPYSPKIRNPGGGDNLFVASIVALDADTGRYVWHYQQNPNEAWDYKATMNMIAATIPIDGRPRKVLMQAPTNGFFYVLDRETGKLISAEKTGKVTWAHYIDLKTGRPVEAPDIRYENGPVIIYPSMIGTHNWQAMSYSPATGLVYIPYMKMGGRYSTDDPDGPMTLLGTTVYPVVKDPDDGTGALLAWDPVSQQARWKVPIDTIWNGGTLATAGGLVFQGAGNGWFSAYDARSGERLWRFNAGLGIVGAPMSYSAGGRQFVSVLVGYGGTTAALSSVLNAGWKYGAQPRRLLTFAIGGRKRLPPSPPHDMTVKALDDPDLVIDEAQVAKGRKLAMACIACHGVNFEGAGSPAPDLRESALSLSEEAVWQVVHEGTLAERGMPKISRLTREQVRSIHMLIRASAREALAKQAAAK